jgi:hypothetical protein
MQTKQPASTTACLELNPLLLSSHLICFYPSDSSAGASRTVNSSAQPSSAQLISAPLSSAHSAPARCTHLLTDPSVERYSAVQCSTRLTIHTYVRCTSAHDDIVCLSIHSLPGRCATLEVGVYVFVSVCIGVCLYPRASGVDKVNTV